MVEKKNPPSPEQRRSKIAGIYGESTTTMKGRFVSTHMRGELGAVDVTLLEYGGVSVKSFIRCATLTMAGIGAIGTGSVL